MKRIKTVVSIILIVVLCFVISACGSSAENTGNDSSVPAGTESAEDKSSMQKTSDDASETITDPPVENTKEERLPQNLEEFGTRVLVVYFSATGTTKGVAEKIAEIESAELYEIFPEKPYSSEDLNYNDSNSRTSKEQNDDTVRPAIGSESIEMSGYSRIYVGYPIWFGQEPRIMDTFAESNDFGNAEVIPFCTSGSSGIGKSGTDLAKLAGTGNWLEGQRFDGEVSEDDLRSWIDGLK